METFKRFFHSFFFCLSILLLILIGLFSIDIIGSDHNNIPIDFPFSINLTLPIFTNINSELFNSVLFDMDFSFIYYTKSVIYLGVYLEMMSSVMFMVKSLETIFWIACSPFLLLFYLVEGYSPWPFPTFPKTALDVNFGLITGIKVVDKTNLKINFSLKLGLGFYTDEYLDYEQNTGVFLIPQILIKFPLSKGGIGINTSYKLIFVRSGNHPEMMIFYPYLGVYFYFNSQY